NVLDSDAILVVEGRADVLNLLKYGIKNAVAVGGTNIPPTITELCSKKIATAFTDGDRGGELIVKELLQVADIDYVARAPEGKCVEELTQKEIIRALRQKIPVEQVMDMYKIKPIARKKREIVAKRKSLIRERPVSVRTVAQVVPIAHRAEIAPPPEIQTRVVQKEAHEHYEEPEIEAEEPEDWFKHHVEELDGTLTARLFDRNNNPIRDVAVRDLARELKESNGSVHGVIFDGVITQRLLDIAAEKGLDYLIGAKMGSIAKTPVGIKVITSGQ
ncbi:MAG: toprim domain-containing protein, partial [Methanothrix sp.]